MSLRILSLLATLAFAPPALAATAIASSGFTIELTDVRDASGARIETGWFAFGEGIPGARQTQITGNAGLLDLIESSAGGELGIGQSINFSVDSGGTTFGAGQIEDGRDGSLEIFFENFSGIPLEFSFRYELDQFASARIDAPGELADAETFATLSDDNGDFLSSLVRADDGAFTGTGSATFTLASGTSNLIFGALSAGTFAAAPVPEPGTWVLLGAGIGLVAWRTRARRNGKSSRV